MSSLRNVLYTKFPLKEMLCILNVILKYVLYIKCPPNEMACMLNVRLKKCLVY